MAYGQTGSGKTHTMLGSHDLDMEIDSESLNKDEGIIPRSAKEMFRLVFLITLILRVTMRQKRKETKVKQITKNFRL